MFSGSGRGLFDIPQSALSSEVFRVASGSVTASVSPQYGFRVQSLDSGSQITGSVNISGSLTVLSGSVLLKEASGSFSGSFQGDGSRLTNLNVPPQITYAIASGSVTASVSPAYGFRVLSIK
jgi:hypothetical protein